MLQRWFLLTVLGCVSAFAPGAAAASANATSQELPPELASLLAAAHPTWSSSAALQLGAGYKDNLLLSPSDREKSEFLRYGLEAFLWRLPRGGTDFSAFLNAQQTHYFSGRTINNEAEAFSQFEWRYRPVDTLKLGLAVQGYYLDEVFDVSDTEIRRVVANLKVHGLTVGPTVRWTFRPSWWLEAHAIGKREKYEDGENDSKTGEGGLRLGWTGRRIELSIGADRDRRRFDRRVQYSFGGRPQDETLLSVRESKGDVRLGVTWDEAAHWKTTTRAGRLKYEDNGSGFFNYREDKVTHEVEWTKNRWMVDFEGSAKRIDFDVQTVGLGLSPPARVKNEFELKLRVERKFSDRWLGYFEYGWERSRSNDPLTSYRVNEGLLGVRWNWEK